MQKEKQPTFVIRKLTIGAASVLVGLSFFGAKNQIVHADTVNSDQNAQSSAVQTQDNQNQAPVSQNDVVQTDKTNHTQINYQDQNGQSIAPSKNIDTEYQGYYKKTQGQVTYHDDTTNQDIGNSQVSGYVGQKPDLTKSYTNKGYDVVNSNQSRLSQNSQDNNYTVHLKHHIDSHVTNTQKATNTINYVDSQNNKLANSQTQSCIFQTRQDTDRVTGKTTTVLSETQHVFSGTKNPVIDGYITNNAKSNSVTVTPTDLNKQENIIYNKLGEFIMTDTDNNIIGTQTYQNDDQDASQVINLAPDINGYKLTSKFDKILDPTKNTTLIYQKINQANPSNPDNPNKGNTDDNQPDNPSTNPDKPNKGNSGITNPSNPDNPNKGNTDNNQPDNPSTNPNNPNKSDSDKDNPNKGNSGVTNPNQPNNPNKGNTSNPSEPDSGKTDQDKPSDSTKPDDPKSQTAKPGDVVKPNDPYNNKADNTDNGKVKLIINDVDETGHILLNPITNKPYTQEYDQMLKDGQDDANYNVTFNPVISGYITDTSENDDIVITRKMGQKTINIKYRKLGQYIFKDKDGNTIKDPMTYSNMGDDPTQIDALNDAPTIPGYELEENQSVAIDDPTKDTTLIYDKLPDSTITLDFIDETNDQQIGQKVLTGKIYSVSDAMSQMQLAAADYESQGYVLDSSDLQYDPTFSQQNQTYKTYFKHNTKRSLKEKRFTHRTIHFIDKLTGKPMQEDAVQTAEWKKYQVTDSVTGVTTAENTWQVNTDESKYQHYGDDQYESFKVPFYNGWRTDESIIQSVDLPSTPDDPDANKEITIYYTQNGHFKIHMIKAKQIVVGYTTYTDSNGQTHTVRDPSKDRYKFVEDTDNKLNKEEITYTNDRQSYQTINGDIPVPGEGLTDKKADADDPQRKTDGKDIKITHKLNGGKSIADLVPDNKKYVLHSEEYQKHVVPKKYFTSYRLKVIKGQDGQLHVQDGDPFTTGWPFRHHSDGNQDRQMDQFYASQNLDVYYRPYAVNGHKIDKHGNVGGGEFGKVVNFNVKKYNPAEYCGYDKWSNDGEAKLKTPLIAKDGSWSDPDEGHDGDVTKEDPNADFTDKDSDVPLNGRPDGADAGSSNIDANDQDENNNDPDKDYNPDDGELDNNKNLIDTSDPHYGDNIQKDPDPWGKDIPDDNTNDYDNLNSDDSGTDDDTDDTDSDNNDSGDNGSSIILDDPNVTRDETNTTIHLHKKHKTPNADSKNTHISGTYHKTSHVQVAVANAKNSVNIDAPIMFYKVLVNGQEVARDLTKDQLENYTVNVNSPIINGETPDQSMIKLSYNDPENSTVIVKYTKTNQTKPDNPDTPNKGGTGNSNKPDSDKTKPNNPNKSDSNKDNPANLNKGNTNDSSKPLAPVNQDQSNQSQTKPNKPDTDNHPLESSKSDSGKTNNQDKPTNPAKGSNKSNSNSQTSPIMPSNPNGSSPANLSKSDSNSQTSPITPSNPVRPSNTANLTNPNNTNSDQNNSQTAASGKQNNNAENSQQHHKNYADAKSIKKNKSNKSKSENVRTKKKTNNVHHKTAGSTPSNTNIHRISTGDAELIHKKLAKANKLDLSLGAGYTNTVADTKQNAAKLAKFNATSYASRGISAGSNSYTAAVNTNNAQAQNARASNSASNSAISRYTRSSAMSAMTMPVAQVKLQHAQNSVQGVNNQNAGTLPQTGRANYNMALPAIGLAVLVNIELFGLAKKRKQD